MGTTRIVRGALLATASLVVGVAGVASASSASTTTAPTTTAPATPAAPAPTTTAPAPPPATSTNPQPRESLQQGGVLRLAVASLATNWNPFLTGGNELDTASVLAPMSYTMWRFDAAGTPVLNTDYVASVTESGGTANPDPSSGSEPSVPPASEAASTPGSPCTLPADPFTVTYNLNPAAVWNDGTPITVADFQANWAALNGTNADFHAISAAGYDRIGAIEQGADDHQVVVRFCEPYADYEALFINLVPAVAVADPTVFNEGWAGPINPDWFAGPFTLGAYDAGQGIVELIPNDGWWGSPPLLERITFRVVGADRTPQAFANGEIDSFEVGTDPNGYQLAATTPGAEVRNASGSGFRQLTLNTSAGVLTDHAVRQAIGMSLDRTAIATADLSGLPAAVEPLNNHIFTPTSPYYQDNAGPLATYDPTAAAALLDEAGWAAGADGVRAKDGRRLTVSFSRIAGVRVSGNEAALVQTQLAAVGFEVQIVDLPLDTWFESVTSGDFELVAFTWIGSSFPYRGAAQLYGNGSPSNYGFSAIAELDPLLDRLAVETDDTARGATANEIDAVLWDYGHSIPLYQQPDLVAVPATLANWGAFGVASPVWTDIGYTA